MTKTTRLHVTCSASLCASKISSTLFLYDNGRKPNFLRKRNGAIKTSPRLVIIAPAQRMHDAKRRQKFRIVSFDRSCWYVVPHVFFGLEFRFHLLFFLSVVCCLAIALLQLAKTVLFPFLNFTVFVNRNRPILNCGLEFAYRHLALTRQRTVEVVLFSLFCLL